jgi:DNA invertase Pin-like site-specific DNA recombinase
MTQEAPPRCERQSISHNGVGSPESILGRSRPIRKPRRRKPGRPASISAPAALTIGMTLARGVSIDEIARAAGISSTTLYRLIRKSELDAGLQKLAGLSGR